MAAFARGIDTLRKHQSKMRTERLSSRLDDLRPIHEYRPRAREVSSPTAEELTASHDATAGPFVAEDGQPEEAGPPIDPVALRNQPAGSDRENRENEAKLGENAVSIQDEEPASLASNLTTAWGLDKPHEQPFGGGGGASADLLAPSPGG